MNCNAVQDRLSDYIDNRLEGSVRAEIEEHLHGCADCQIDAEDLAYTIRLAAAEPELDPPPALTTRIMAHVRDEAEQPSLLQRVLGFIRFNMPIQATAAVAIAILAVFLYRGSKPPGRVDERQSAEVASLPPESGETLPRDSLSSDARLRDSQEPESGGTYEAPKPAAPGEITLPRGGIATLRALPAADREWIVQLEAPVTAARSVEAEGQPRASAASRLAADSPKEKSFIGEVESARQRAIATGQPQTVTFDVPRVEYANLQQDLARMGAVQSGTETRPADAENNSPTLRVKVTLIPPAGRVTE